MSSFMTSSLSRDIRFSANLRLSVSKPLLQSCVDRSYRQIADMQTDIENVNIRSQLSILSLVWSCKITFEIVHHRQAGHTHLLTYHVKHIRTRFVATQKPTFVQLMSNFTMPVAVETGVHSHRQQSCSNGTAAVDNSDEWCM